VAAGDDAAFPNATDEPRWDQTLRQAVADDIAQLAGQANVDDARGYFHGQLSHDALRVLAGLELVSSAYSQITIRALDPDDPDNADRPGPDTPSGYAPDPGLRAYIDTLDGRSSNRWFYRSAYVDGAHNVSPLSLATPPVYLPDVVAPRAPVLTRALGGEREVTLNWAPNREPDLAEYRVLRALDAASAADARLMTVVHTETVTSVASQPADWSFTDSPVAPLQTVYYRLVAVDQTGNVSAASEAVPARAYDDSLPDVPALSAAWSAPAAPAEAEVTWTAAGEETLLEMRAAGLVIWDSVGDWLPPGDQSVILVVATTASWEFRLRARKDTGATALGDIQALEALG
jgi:hypothetical protein